MTFSKYTKRTITTLKDFSCELNRIHQQGYATDVSEEVEGCHCVSAPILKADGLPLAAIWVTAPANRLPTSQFARVARPVIDTALRIAAALQHRKPLQKTLTQDLAKTAAAYIAKHLTEELDLEQMATELNVGSSSFRHGFRAAYGIGPHQYHLRLRLDAAMNLLKTTGKTVGTIAQELGYNDQNYFSAVFKKKTGLSPQNYRIKKTSGQSAGKSK